MKRILLALGFVAALVLPAIAQSSKATLNTEVSTNLPDNTTGAITPAIVRTTLNDMISSWQQATQVNAQSGTTYTILVGDYGKLVTFSNAAAVAVTLPQATGSFATFNVYVRNLGAGTVTITPTTSTINGNATLTLNQGQSFQIVSDGANYQLGAGADLGTLSTDLIPGCRITLETGVAYSSSDQSAKSTVFCTPVDSLTVQIYNGFAFIIRTMTGELSVTLSGTSGNTAYDVYLIFDSGLVKACWGPAWTTSTDGLGNRGSGAGTAQITNSIGGRWTNAVSMTCKNGASSFTVAANQGTLVGGFKTATADQVSDTAATRMVWDLFRPIGRTLVGVNTASSYAYTSSTIRQCNAGSAGGGVPVQVSSFRGMAGWPINMRSLSVGFSTNAAVQVLAGGIGLNSTTANSAQVLLDNASSSTYNQFNAPLYSEYRGQPPVGSNTMYCLEGGNANVTFMGNNGTTTKAAGMVGETWQ